VPGFLRATLKANELRLMRMGLLRAPLKDTSMLAKANAIGRAYAWKLLSRARSQRLTDTYLNDPHVLAVASDDAATGMAKAARSAAKLSVV